MLWKVVIEGIILSLCLYLVCAWGIRNGAVNMVYLYEKKVQDRAVALGLTTEEKIRTSGKRFKLFGLLLYFVYALVCVYVVNGTRGFLPCFLQFTAIFLIMGVFDRICVDTIWVGHTNAWVIPGTEDLRPYISRKAHLIKWIMTLVMYPAMAAVVCGIMTLVLG